MKCNIHIYIYYLLRNPYQFFNGLINPSSFPCGNDTNKIIINGTSSVKKYFKHITILDRTLQALTILENTGFIPKTLKINKYKNTLEQEYCGNVLNLKKNLPDNWKQQLLNIRSVFLEKQFLITDIDVFDLNPYIIYNLCCKDNTLYIIDFGDWEVADSLTITTYFEKLEDKIDYILNSSRLSIILYVFNILIYKLLRSITKKILIIINLMKTIFS